MNSSNGMGVSKRIVVRSARSGGLLTSKIPFRTTREGEYDKIMGAPKNDKANPFHHGENRHNYMLCMQIPPDYIDVKLGSSFRLNPSLLAVGKAVASRRWFNDSSVLGGEIG